MTNPMHCEWFRIRCDEDGFVEEIKLEFNNITGEFPSNSLAKLYKLKTINLAKNNLSGTMAETTWGNDDTSIFFNLRELTDVDLSQNNLSGEVDILFAPELKHVNFSHNNFTSVNSYKKFKGSYKTLQVCDLSYNSIQQEARKLMKNMPPNIEQLFLLKIRFPAS